MTFDQYQVAARRTQNPALTYEEKRNHALFGMCSEVGELHALYQKRYQGHEIDKEKVKDEVFDVMWFVSEFCDSEGLTMEEVAQHGDRKLKKRYPDGFSEERSVNREEYRHETD